jgi:hypothetical protein
LVPRIGLVGLLGSQNLNEPIGECVKDIGVGDVVVQGSRIELSQDVDLPDTAVDTI